MPFLLPIASALGISVFRLITYAILIASVVTALAVVRQHYVNKGWYQHKAAVEKQDNRAVEASKRVEEKTQECSNTSGFWDVITQSCKLQED